MQFLEKNEKKVKYPDGGIVEIYCRVENFYGYTSVTVNY